ncbi:MULTISPECIES: phytase [Olivibacter]|jgi:3-phytase|uniref:Phytase n=1 Tax=Olivibacter oleidegradans TaxID=760123 RepID=A0ABV6HP91_9SPHI|nr:MULTISPECIES: phytase [Olivibacter]QEL04425.1 phytase [Olivibacter sp. LS-1]
MNKRNKVYLVLAFMATVLAFGCQSASNKNDSKSTQPLDHPTDTLVATVITEKVKHDSDDPAIWIDSEQVEKSLIIGTDKDSDGALYAFNLQGKIVKRVEGIKRPNNVDIAYGFQLNGKSVDIAVLTERETNKIRVFTLPDLSPVDNGGIDVFVGEEERAPMGIALYTRPRDKQVFAVVGRKSGPAVGYLWQYRLRDNGAGSVSGDLVRKFGKYSGKKEIEAIAVDNELGYIYYSDEQTGIRKYMADPAVNNNEELALFGQSGFSKDHEGIAIYKTGAETGYILVSNQGSHTFMVYPREGTKANKNEYPLLAEIPVSAMETDGADASSVNLGAQFPEGILVAMSTNRTFHVFDWRKVNERIISKK